MLTFDSALEKRVRFETNIIKRVVLFSKSSAQFLMCFIDF